MSGESAEHIRLVENLVELIVNEHQGVRNFVLFADHRSYGINQPPTIGGFKPDVFAHDVPFTFRVLAEAKTPNDLEEERSHTQVVAFLEHLSLYRNAAFYLGVPWLAKPKANGFLRRLKTDNHDNILIRVIGF